jgi:hypothetical protein
MDDGVVKLLVVGRKIHEEDAIVFINVLDLASEVIVPVFGFVTPRSFVLLISAPRISDANQLFSFKFKSIEDRIDM